MVLTSEQTTPVSDALVHARAIPNTPAAHAKTADVAVFLPRIRPAMNALRPVLADGAQVAPDAATCHS
jgi:hypothetical protein